MEPVFAPGLTARVELRVTDSDTAQAIGSGDVPVLGTPRMIALAETATVAATAREMPAGMTTVGVRIEIEHRLATPIGRTVAAQATLAKVDGRRLIFEVHVTEVPADAPAAAQNTRPQTGQKPVPYAERRVVAEGRVERVLVDRQRFLSKAFD